MLININSLNAFFNCVDAILLVAKANEGCLNIGNNRWSLRVVKLLNRMEWVRKIGIATETILNHVTQRNL